MLKINSMVMDNGKPRFYVFDDVAELFWRDDYSKSNHAAEDRIIDHMLRAHGCTRLPAGRGIGVMTPHGPVKFDSESGCFECHADEEAPVAFVVTVIEELRQKFDAAREVLR